MNQTNKSRGGKRENAGRQTDYRKKCFLFAVQLHHLCSESTARRMLNDWRWDIRKVAAKGAAELLTSWDELSEFNQGQIYGVLETRVANMLKAGWGTRL
jgi:hypothetical protein